MPWSVRSRCVKDPLNPSHIIYACENKDPITHEAEVLEIIGTLVRDVDNGWYTKLKEEVDRARDTEPTTNRGHDGKLIVVFAFLISFVFTF